MTESSYSLNSSSSAVVSIIVPAYNREDLITETLENIQKQSYQNWECIVVDDGSSDRTPDIVKRYAAQDPRIHYVRQRNLGPARARNHGLRKASGEFIQFWDSDDLLEPRKIELQVEYLNAHPEVDIVYGSARYFSTERPEERRYCLEEPDRPWMPETSGAGYDIVKEFIEKNIMVIEAALLRKTVIETVGYFDTRLRAVEDWDFFLRCAVGGKRFQYLSETGTCALIRSHPTSLTNEKSRVRQAVFSLQKRISATISDKELLEFHRRTASIYEAQVTEAEIQEAFEAVRYGKRKLGARRFVSVALRRQNKREQIKYLFCAVASLVAPRATFDPVIITAPASNTIKDILRYYFRNG